MIINNRDDGIQVLDDGIWISQLFHFYFSRMKFLSFCSPSDFLLSRANSEDLEDYRAILRVVPTSHLDASNTHVVPSPFSSASDRRMAICVLQVIPKSIYLIISSHSTSSYYDIIPKS